MQNEASPKDQQNKGERLTPQQLFKKHLQDPNHHVTDEELRNLKVGVDAEDEVELKKESELRKDKVSSLNINNTPSNPYDVLK